MSFALSESLPKDGKSSRIRNKFFFCELFHTSPKRKIEAKFGTFSSINNVRKQLFFRFVLSQNKSQTNVFFFGVMGRQMSLSCVHVTYQPDIKQTAKPGTSVLPPPRSSPPFGCN